MCDESNYFSEIAFFFIFSVAYFKKKDIFAVNLVSFGGLSQLKRERIL